MTKEKEKTAPRAALPVVLIAGYLGAGKTTLVNHLLRHAQGRRIAVLVNDFGSINIDAELIAAGVESAPGAAHSASVISLAGGCLCCSFGDDLVGTLAALATRSPPLDVCLIELSGVALPASVARSVRLVQTVELVATLVLADAEHIRRQAADRYVGDTVSQQLRDADWLMLTKTDLVTPAALQATSSWLQQAHPQARLWAGDVQSVWPDLLLGWRAGDPQGLTPDTPVKWPGFNGPPQTVPRGPLPRRIAPWVQPASHAATVFESYACGLPDAVDLAALGRHLAAPTSGVLRAKALVAGQLLQVAGGRWAVTPVAGAACGQLVMIGLVGWNPQALFSG